MNILIINPILYTSETPHIVRANTIKDCMIYDLCLGFIELGHRVTLAAGEPFKPLCEERYPFHVEWFDCRLQGIFKANRIPVMSHMYRYIKERKDEFDLIISSELFSVNSLAAYRAAPMKTIVWHELARHNAIFHQVPSKFWYGVIVRYFMKNALVVARSIEARAFASQYCSNESDQIIDHGVNLELFSPSEDIENYFAVCSQLIGRKRVDGILDKFHRYLDTYDSTARLYVIGDGELKDELMRLVERDGIASNVVFTGKLSHEALVPLLSKAQALLVNTVQDNNMISIVESIAVGTPIITTSVPLNASYVDAEHLGIVNDDWSEDDLAQIVSQNAYYVKNCLKYRESLSTKRRAKQFIELSAQLG